MFFFYFHRLEIFHNKFNLNILFLFTNLSTILSFIYYLFNLIFYLIFDGENYYLFVCKQYVTFYMFVVMLIYNLVSNARKAHSEEKYYSFDSAVAHLVLPTLIFIDWLFFTEHQFVSSLSLFISLIYPIIYCIMVFYKGIKKKGKVFYHSNTYYPYFFLDIEKYGVKKVGRNVVILLLFFLSLGYFFLLVNNCIFV